MKPLNSLLLLTILFAFMNVKSQSYDLLFNIAEKAMVKENYSKANIYFTKAIDVNNTSNAHFNRALSRFQLDDLDGGCYDLKQAAYQKDFEATQAFYKFCTVKDTIDDNINELVIRHTSKQMIYPEYWVLSKLKNDTVRYELINGQKIYTQLKNIPILNGSEELSSFIAYNTEYPRMAIDNETQGTVIVSFIITEKGEVTNIKIENNRDELLNKSSIKVIEEIKKFEPATLNDAPPRTL
tara:strand:- start:692 stop:1408 length:717 start_codon:yes stop_codon:yes gene_type:complete